MQDSLREICRLGISIASGVSLSFLEVETVCRETYLRLLALLAVATCTIVGIVGPIAMQNMKITSREAENPIHEYTRRLNQEFSFN